MQELLSKFSHKNDFFSVLHFCQIWHKTWNIWFSGPGAAHKNCIAVLTRTILLSSSPPSPFIIFVITIFIIMKKIIAIVIISAVTAMQCLRRWHHICSGASMLSIQTPDNWKGEESAEHRIYQNQVSRPLFLLMKCSVLEWKFHLGQKLAWNWDHASNPIFSNDFTLFERETLQPHRDQYQSKEREKLELSIHFC